MLPQGKMTARTFWRSYIILASLRDRRKYSRIESSREEKFLAP